MSRGANFLLLLSLAASAAATANAAATAAFPPVGDLPRYQPAENSSIDEIYDDVSQGQDNDDEDIPFPEIQNDYAENKWSFTQWFLSIVGPFGFWTSPEGTDHVDLKPPERCEPCSCGMANERRRIVGGTVTKVKQYPWMAMLMYGRTFYCGGSLISDKYVLTAAHCLYGFDHRRIRVRLLEHDRDKPSETEVIERRVMRVRLHRHYDSSNYNNDIALIRLSEPVKIEGDLRTVCMPTKGHSFTGEQGLVTGWGVTKPLGQPSSQLREVTVPIMANSECRKTAYGQQRITENMMCAGYPEGKKDSCQGDSGGPLHIKNNTLHHLVGVVSWGEGCAQPNYPGVYTRVNRYITWITRNTVDSCFCS
ncbi:trypsin-1-like [Schistocerca piceifrons]|uniref:trypsin-1-like n=1 Tax=Schistocerca piceifrons TaxID=274613 RepID=UPI001F5ECA3D|nr:trypsin-1-like [Schistocerca piceifrons]